MLDHRTEHYRYGEHLSYLSLKEGIKIKGVGLEVASVCPLKALELKFDPSCGDLESGVQLG